MRRGLLHASLTVVSLVVMACVWIHCGARVTQARELALGAHRTSGDLVRLAALEALPSRVAPAQESAGLLIGRLQQALSAAGIPPDALTRIVPGESDPATSDPALARRDVRAILSGVSLAELGVFFDIWRRTEPSCIITSVSITPLEAACDRDPNARAITTTLTLRSTFFQHAGDTP